MKYITRIIILIAVMATLFLLRGKADTIVPTDAPQVTQSPKVIFCEAICRTELVEVCSAKYNACTEVPASFCLNDVNGVCEYVFVSF